MDVRFIELQRPIRPSEYTDVLAPLLPSRYAPRRSIGTGLQSVYLTRLPEALAAALIDLIGVEARDIIRGHLWGGSARDSGDNFGFTGRACCRGRSISRGCDFGGHPVIQLRGRLVG